jgi:DNA-binding CsgD family transcriptional regulator
MVVGAGAPRNDSRFVGRQAEAALLGVTLDQSSDAPAVLVVRGEPGIGKSRLLAEAVVRAQAKGHHVVWVRANAMEARVPFGALSVALDRAAAGDPVFARGAAAMRTFIGGAPESDESARLSFAQICDTFSRTLVEAGERDPACIVVDDLHLLDYESLALLGVALGRVTGHRVSFVCSTRPPGRDLDTHAADLLARLAQWPDAEEIDLGPLVDDQVREVLQDVFGKSASPAVADAVTRRSGGNPLFVLEMARSLADLDILDTVAPGVGFHDEPGALHLTRHTAILQRLFPLSPDCRHVAQILAVLHRIRLTDLDLVAELAQLGAADMAAAFDELEKRGIIVADEQGTWSLFHDFVADALYDDIGPAERRRVHRRVAEHLLGRRDAGDVVDLTRLAWHVAKSADVGDAGAARVLGEAAESIKHTGPVSAADLCQKALALLPPDSPQRGELLSLRTRCLILAGRPRDAVEAGRAALEATTSHGEERSRTATAVIGSLFDIGRVDEARALAEREACADSPSTFVLAQRAMMIAAQGDVEQTRSALDEALATPPRTPGEQVLVRSFVASATLLIGAVAEGLDHLEQVRRVAPEAGTNLCAYGLSRRCWSLVATGFVADGLTATDEAEAALGAVGAGTYSVGVTASRIGLDWMRGEWDHALAGIAASRRGAELPDNVVIGRYLQNIEIDVRTARGELREALALIEQPLDGDSGARSAWSTAGTLCATGDDAAARELLLAVVDHPIEAAWLPHALLRLLELEHRAGHDEDARAALSELGRRCDPGVDPRRWSNAIVLRGQAVVDGDRDAALASAAEADIEGLVYEAALARLLAGQLDGGDTEHLLAAHHVFGELGAEADRRRAGSLLRDRGAKVPRRRRTSPGQLTAAEAEIARLVQAGMRNREIARTTHYSERTVEVYLSRLYAKVGVSSRLQLARLLDAQGIPAAE